MNEQNIAAALAILDVARWECDVERGLNPILGAIEHLVDQIGNDWNAKSAAMRWFRLYRNQLEKVA